MASDIDRRQRRIPGTHGFRTRTIRQTWRGSASVCRAVMAYANEAPWFDRLWKRNEGRLLSMLRTARTRSLP